MEPAFPLNNGVMEFWAAETSLTKSGALSMSNRLNTSHKYQSEKTLKGRPFKSAEFSLLNIAKIDPQKNLTQEELVEVYFMSE